VVAGLAPVGVIIALAAGAIPELHHIGPGDQVPGRDKLRLDGLLGIALGIWLAVKHYRGEA
jgi:hypothetical protein